jgi:hypothetical protein
MRYRSASSSPGSKREEAAAAPGPEPERPRLPELPRVRGGRGAVPVGVSDTSGIAEPHVAQNRCVSVTVAEQLGHRRRGEALIAPRS